MKLKLENVVSHPDETVHADLTVDGERYHLVRDDYVLEATRLSDGLCKELSPKGTEEEIYERVRAAFSRGPLFDRSPHP